MARRLFDGDVHARGPFGRGSKEAAAAELGNETGGRGGAERKGIEVMPLSSGRSAGAGAEVPGTREDGAELALGPAHLRTLPIHLSPLWAPWRRSRLRLCAPPRVGGLQSCDPSWINSRCFRPLRFVEGGVTAEVRITRTAGSESR